MTTLNAVEDIAQRIHDLTALERARLLRILILQDDALYRIKPPTKDEFATDEEPLGWDAGGWDDAK